MKGGRAAEVRAARQQITAASAARDVERVQLERTRILAPVAGVVMSRNVNPGDVIAPSVSAPTLFKIVDPARVEVRLEVEELLAADIAAGMPVRFMLPGTQTEVGSGKLQRIAPQVEKRSIGADDARIRADSMIRPAWSEFVPPQGKALPPINYRLEAWVEFPG
jgi:multidrug resistance efflux pump